DEDQHQADGDVLELGRQVVPGQVPGDGRRHDDLHEFRGLEADHPGDVDPAGGAHGRVAHHLHRHQQAHADQVGQRYPAGHEARLELGDDEGGAQAETERGALLDHQVPVLAAGRIQYEQAAGRQHQQDQQQPAVDVQALQQRGAALEYVLVGDVAVEFLAFHRCALVSWGAAVRGRNSGLSWPSSPSSQASITCLTTGAATPEPDSPFSTITATAIFGSSAGAKATNRAWSRWRSCNLLRLYFSPCLMATTWAVPDLPAMR